MKATGIKLSKETLSTVLQGSNSAVPDLSETVKSAHEIDENESEIPFIDHFSDIPIFDYDDDNIDEDDHININELNQKDSNKSDINDKNKQHLPSLIDPDLMVNKEHTGNISNAENNEKRSNSVKEDFQEIPNPSIYLISQSIGFSVKNKFVTEEKLRTLFSVPPDSL